MCNCAKANVNGEHGYSWNDDRVGVYPVNPPALAEGDVLIHDEPGRCGGPNNPPRGKGTDSHCHHFRLVTRNGEEYLLVRHGGGDEAFRIGGRGYRQGLAAVLKSLTDSNARYWAFQALYSLIKEERHEARSAERTRWHTAACQKRIKLRRKQGTIRAEIIEPVAVKTS